MDYVGLYSYQFGHFLALCNGRVYLLYHHVDPSSIACNTYQVVSSDGIVYIIVCMSFDDASKKCFVWDPQSMKVV